MGVAINGFGRIGRAFLRLWLEKGKPFEIVAVNSRWDERTDAELLRRDTVHGPGPEVVGEKGRLEIAGEEILHLREEDPRRLPWKELGVEVVIEATGRFRENPEVHLEAGAEKVLLSAPGRAEAFLVPGVNDEVLATKPRVVSLASCTTNCLAPILKVLNDEFGVEEGSALTVHSVTNDQRILDSGHSKPRRGRSLFNIIPTSSGAGESVAKVLPELAGRIKVSAVRVPVPDVSYLHVVVLLRTPGEKDELLAAFRKREGQILGIAEWPAVSSDFIGDTRSAIVDAGRVKGGRLAEIGAWYDNEWGYSARLVETAERMIG